MRTGILGGTFNPPHNGHLAAARLVRDKLALDQVLFIPTNQPPHKDLPHATATTAQRCEMVRRMVEDLPWASLSTIEIERGGASYTVDTLYKLKERGIYGDLFLIMGTDMLMMLDCGWRAPDEICKMCTLAVVARAEGDGDAMNQKADQLRRKYGADIRLIDGPVLEVSSTRLREGGALSFLTPPPVFQYIQQNRLYDNENHNV